MGRLFTYMVKAAHRERLTGERPSEAYLAGYRAMMGIPERPIPTYNYFTPYGVKRDALPTGAYSLPFDRRGWVGDRRTRRWNSVDNLYGASTDVDKWQALNAGGGNNWGTAYVTAVNPAFISPEAIAQFLDAHPEYERELIRAARTRGGPRGFDFRDGGSDTPSYLTISNSPYAVDGGRVNIQLALNLAKAYRERAERQAAEADAHQPQNAETPANPVQVPVIPEGTNVATGQDGRQYLSSNTDRKAQTAANIGAALAAGQNPFAGARVRVHTLAAPGTTAPPPPATPVQAPQPQATTPRVGTFSEPAFVSSPTQQVSFYNLPPGMTQEQAMQIWNTTGRSRMQRYLERTGRQGANNIQVSPDGSNLRLMHSNGGSTEMDTSLPIRLTGSNPKALRIYGSNPKAPRSTNSTSKTLSTPNLRERPSRPVNLRARVTGTPRPQLGQVPQPHA